MAQWRFGRARHVRPAGREPLVARSTLRLRLWLATFGLVFSVAVAAAALLWENPPIDVVILGSGFAVLAVVAAIDIVVVLVRMRERANRGD